MKEHELHRHLEISDRDGTVASADVTITQHTARASLRAAAGHLAPGVRARLVDAVLDLPELHGGAHLQAAFPLGDSETLYRLRERCTDVTTHPAGATALLEANIAPGRTPHRRPSLPPPSTAVITPAEGGPGWRNQPSHGARRIITSERTH